MVSEKSHPKGINWVPVVILELTLKLKPIVFKLPIDKGHIQKIYLLQNFHKDYIYKLYLVQSGTPQNNHLQITAQNM